jgi:hypothetical protein
MTKITPNLLAEFLVELGIDSISLNPDSLLKTKLTIAFHNLKIGWAMPTFKIKMAISS